MKRQVTLKLHEGGDVYVHCAEDETRFLRFRPNRNTPAPDGKQYTARTVKKLFRASNKLENVGDTYSTSDKLNWFPAREESNGRRKGLVPTGNHIICDTCHEEYKEGVVGKNSTYEYWCRHGHGKMRVIPAQKKED